MKYLLALTGLSEECRAIKDIQNLIINDIIQQGHTIDVLLCTKQHNNLNYVLKEYNPIGCIFEDEPKAIKKRSLKFIRILEYYLQHKLDYDYIIHTRFDIILCQPYHMYPINKDCFNFTCHASGPYTYKGNDYIDTDCDFWIFPGNLGYVQKLYNAFSTIDMNRELSAHPDHIGQAFHRCNAYLNDHNIETNIMYKTLNYLVNGSGYFKFVRQYYDNIYQPYICDTNDFKNPHYCNLLRKYERIFPALNWFE